jgi:hypothetical protein
MAVDTIPQGAPREGSFSYRDGGETAEVMLDGSHIFVGVAWLAGQYGADLTLPSHAPRRREGLAVSSAIPIDREGQDGGKARVTLRCQRLPAGSIVQGTVYAIVEVYYPAAAVAGRIPDDTGYRYTPELAYAPPGDASGTHRMLTRYIIGDDGQAHAEHGTSGGICYKPLPPRKQTARLQELEAVVEWGGAILAEKLAQ